MDRYATYLRRLALFAVLASAALACFNVFVDPYGDFDVPRVAGVNRLPLGFNRHPLLAKALAVARVRPRSIILGNSRAESAYDPGHPGFAERPAYNLGIGGAGLSELRRYFLEAMAAGDVRRVLLALDLTMMEPSLRAQGRVPGPVMLTDESGSPHPGRKWRRLAFVLLSGATSADSWWSLRHQRDAVAVYSPDGRREEAYDELQVEREGGHRSASLRTESAFLATTLRDVASPAFRRSYDAVLGELAEVLDLAARRDVRVDIVINPIHARHTYVYAAAGLWPIYERWKRDLAALASRPARPVALWDFSGVSECTAEPMPPAGDAARKMRWYRESGHFRPRLGAIVLDRVYGGGATACPGLGARLAPESVDSMLAAQRAALGTWVARHRGDVAEIDELARRYGRGPSRSLSAAGERDQLAGDPVQ